MASPTITCPVCDASFPISEALAGDIEDRLRNEWDKAAEKEMQKKEEEFQLKLNKEVQAASEKASAEASSEVSKLEKLIADQDKEIDKRKKSFDERLRKELLRIKEEEAGAAKEAAAEEVSKLKKQIREGTQKIKELEEAGEELEARSAEVAAREQGLQATIAKEVKKAVAAAEKKASDETADEYESQIMQKDKKLSDMHRQVNDLKRQLEQSSQQLQGEVYELHLEKLLRNAFPEDDITEVGKGQTGADVVQVVCSKGGAPAGKIIWESKDTKTFYKKWLTKLRSDQRAEKAEIAVLATTALPKDFKARFGLVDGIWVTDFAHAMALATALREQIIQLNSIRVASVSKEEKLEVIYQYLTGVEFKHRVEAIVEAFVAMQGDLNKEKLTALRRWAEREKQLQAVLSNVAGMYGDFQGLAGKALPKIKKLELLPPPSN